MTNRAITLGLLFGICFFIFSSSMNSYMNRLKDILLKPLSYVLILLAKIYQLILSPYLPNACRYSPSCSVYFIEAVKKYGPLKGGWMGLKRIGRCHPWGGHGHDPVP